MKKPKDVTDLANRLASAASTPLVAPSPPPAPLPVLIEEPATATAREAGKRKPPNRSTVPVFLRLSQNLYERYDEEAVRRTRATGRGVTVQQVILDRLEGTSA
jgi:hypothetical protein